MNKSAELVLPPLNVAIRSVDPVSNVICGLPVTVTDSEKFTCTSMTSPASYDPFAVDADTDDTVGAVVSAESENDTSAPPYHDEVLGVSFKNPLRVSMLSTLVTV